jgi:hypothetical protein
MLNATTDAEQVFRAPSAGTPNVWPLNRAIGPAHSSIDDAFVPLSGREFAGSTPPWAMAMAARG